MNEKIKALLVQAQPDPCDALRMELEEHAMDIRIARNCGEAAMILWSDHPPHLVFTEVQLGDGHWGDVLILAAKASAPVNVIVVAAHVDVGFYISAIERGAFDFIVPPFAAPELLHIVRSAAQNALSRRQAQALTGVPAPLLNLQPAEHKKEHALAGAED